MKLNIFLTAHFSDYGGCCFLLTRATFGASFPVNLVFLSVAEREVEHATWPGVKMKM